MRIHGATKELLETIEKSFGNLPVLERLFPPAFLIKIGVLPFLDMPGTFLLLIRLIERSSAYNGPAATPADGFDTTHV